MSTTQYLLIGGGLASSQAAKQLRRKDAEAAITLVSEEPYPPYDRPPLSKEFLRGEKTREDILYDPEAYYREQRIACILGQRVQQMDLESRSAILSNGDRWRFEKALIATGGRPIRLDLPGGDLPGVCYLRTLDDAATIRSRAEQGRRAVVVGAGFIGMEVAASLTLMGVEVTVIEMAPHIWARFADPTLAGFFQTYCTRKGITFLTNDRVTAIQGTDHVSGVVTASGQEIPCDLVCIGVGIVPNVELAEAAGLKVDNGVVVDAYMQTSHPAVYAAGDVVNYSDPIFEKRRRVEHWGHAEYGGQLAGQNMAGERLAYNLLTYVWSDIFDLHLEFAGDETEHDEVLVRGDMASASFVVLFLKNHALTAYFSVNTSAREFRTFQRLIQQKIPLAGKESQLQDPAFAVKTLLQG